MYNFLITYDEGAWGRSGYEMPRDRFCINTDSKTREKYYSLDANAIEELKTFPTLFGYEGKEGNYRVGYIRRIKDRSKSIYIEYEIDSKIPEIPFSKIFDLKLKLDIQDSERGIGEFNRTHWAIKDEDLFEILSKAGLMDTSFFIPLPEGLKRTEAENLADLELNSLRTAIDTPAWQPKRPFTPNILIMKGGGVKGIAYVGALKVLDEYGYKFKHFVGSSAGAITAALLAVGYSSDELGEILAKTNFKHFKDGYFIFSLIKLPFTKGLYKGEAFRIWLETLLRKKFPQFSNSITIKFTHLTVENNLDNRLTIFASTKGRREYAFDSDGVAKTEHSISFACRCSMAIPYFFIPESIGGQRVVDGGVQNNYPVNALIQTDPKLKDTADFLGLYLGHKSVEKNRKLLLLDLFSIWSEAGDEEAKERFIDRTIVIDPRPIKTTDFSLSPIEVKFLLAEGKASALRWLYHWSDIKKPNLDVVEQAEEEASNLRDLIISKHWKSFWKRISILIISLLLLLIGFFYILSSGKIPTIYNTDSNGSKDESKNVITTIKLPSDTESADLIIKNEKGEFLIKISMNSEDLQTISLPPGSYTYEFENVASPQQMGPRPCYERVKNPNAGKFLVNEGEKIIELPLQTIDVEIPFCEEERIERERKINLYQ